MQLGGLPQRLKIDASESSSGSTTHPDKNPSRVPASIGVGEFGRNSSRRIAPANSSARRAADRGSPHLLGLR